MPFQQNRNPSGRTTLVFSIIAAAVTFAAYLPSLSNGFINWDDPAYVYANPDIRVFNLDFIKWAFTHVAVSNWHPLTIISLALDRALWGLNPLGYHLTNAVFHSSNTLLVCLLAAGLVRAGLGDGDELAGKKAVAAGLVTALLFGLHPLHVESVAWVSERKDVLSTFFFLLALLSYLSYVRGPAKGQGRGAGWYAATLLFFAFGLLSKPMVITLPVVLLILDVYPLERLTRAAIARAVIEKVPFFALSGASAAVTVWAQKTGGAILSTGTYPLATRLFVAVRASIFYLYKMILPFGLAPYYPRPTHIHTLSLEYAGSLAAFVIISAFCALAYKRQKLYAAAWLFYLVTLLPVIGIVQVGGQAAADRYTYLPGLAPFFLAGVGASLLYRRRALFTAVVAVVAFVLAVLTVNQITVWRNSVTFWSYEIKMYPRSVPIAYINRAMAYEDAGRLKEALADYDRALELNSGYAPLYNNRGLVLNSLGRYQEAITDFTRAIELDPRYADAYSNRGLALEHLGRYGAAVADFKAAVGLDPQLGAAYYNLANAYSEMGEYELALEAQKKAAELGMR